MRLLYLLALALVGWVQLPVQLLAQTYDSNFYNCNHGLSYGCDSSKLTSEQQAKISKGSSERVSAPIGCAENGSCYGDISSITGRPKTISVGGYYRRDGTYVRGHYRSRR